MQRTFALPTLAFLMATSAASTVHAQQRLTGADAFGDWTRDSPGAMRLIRPQDLPKPLASAPAATSSRIVARPADASPKTMPGFTIAPFVSNLTGARVLRTAPNGDIFVALSQSGRVVAIRPGAGATAPRVGSFASGLRRPYGLAFYPPGSDPSWLYVAQTDKIVRYPYRSGSLTPGGRPEIIVRDLPEGANHWTRDIAFTPDGKTLLVAVGSADNVAEGMPARSDVATFEKSRAVGAAWGEDEWRANVLSFTPEGKDRKVFATGLRNCSGLALQPGTGTPFCAVNERDMLGDNLPPDYVTSVTQGGFYGWPWFYIGANPDNRAGGGPRPDLAGKVTVPDVLLQTHSAPLGVAFDPGGMFPPDWTGDLFVTLHGSWNRAQRTGYKVVRVPFRNGKPTGEYQDFVTGFAVDNESVWGRPTGITFMKDGSMLFSEDGNGTIYRVTYRAPN